MAREQALRRFVVLQATAIGGLFALTTAQAGSFISNMPGNDGTSTFMNAPGGGANGGGVHDSKAAGFTTPGGDPYELNAVTLRLNYFDTISVPMVQLYANVGGNPVGLLETLSSPTPTVGMGNHVFTSTGFVMSPSTTYWIVVWNNSTALNSFQWMASSPSVTPTGVATHFGYRFSNGPPPPTGASATFNSYSIDATLVPEPATFVGIAGAGLLLLIRRRR